MINLLRQLESDHYVRSSPHRDLPLLVWNYTPKTQYENKFGEFPILRRCRGLITDLEGNIVAGGFAKFFNYEEHHISEIPHGQKIEITEKMDGSLLIMFRYMNTVVYSTRGSFYSDQALAASDLYKELYDENWIEDGRTYLFEYISPDNRIVVSYESSDLIHLAVLDSITGHDLPKDSRFKLVPTFEVEGGVFGHDLYEKLKSLNSSNKEGFVIRALSDGTCPDWRCKIKFEDYCMLHRIVTGVSNRSIWESLRDGKSLDEILEICPDEFNTWLKQTRHNLETEYTILLDQANVAFNEVKSLPNRKDQAIWLSTNHPKVAGIVFKMLDGGDYSQIVWKMVKPDSYVQPFQNKGEE